MLNLIIEKPQPADRQKMPVKNIGSQYRNRTARVPNGSTRHLLSPGSRTDNSTSANGKLPPPLLRVQPYAERTSTSPSSQQSTEMNGGRKRKKMTHYLKRQLTLPDVIETECDSSNSAVAAFVNTTSIHGIDQVFVSRSCWEKTFWVCVVFTVSVLVVLQVYKMIVHYVDTPTVTSVKIVQATEGIKFPSLTWCIMSKINRTAVERLYPKMTKQLSEFATASFASASSTALFDYRYFIRQNETSELTREFHDNLTLQLEDALDGNTIEQFFDNTTFTCQGQFQNCWLENGAMSNCCNGFGSNETNGPRVEVKRLIVHSGACYEFTVTNFRQMAPGPIGGLGIVFVYPNEHLLHSAYNSHGGYAIHLYASPADAMLERKPTKLPVGYHSQIHMTATKTKLVDMDFWGRNNCVDPKPKYFDDYSYSNCLAECMLDANLHHCNCTGMYTKSLVSDAPSCTQVQAIDCYKKLVGSAQVGRLAECRNTRCKEKCEHWTYQSTLTVARPFNPVLEDLQVTYWRLPESKINGTTTAASLIIAEIYFDDIKYTEIEQKPELTLESFVSNIGGAMGLWTGASIISWIHLLYFCFVKLVLRRQKGHPLKRTKSRTTFRRSHRQTPLDEHNHLQPPTAPVLNFQLSPYLSLVTGSNSRPTSAPPGNNNNNRSPFFNDVKSPTKSVSPTTTDTPCTLANCEECRCTTDEEDDTYSTGGYLEGDDELMDVVTTTRF